MFNLLFMLCCFIVLGLCGGASWSKLEFTGLETHNVSRLLITIGIFTDISKHSLIIIIIIIIIICNFVTTLNIIFCLTVFDRFQRLVSSWFYLKEPVVTFVDFLYLIYIINRTFLANFVCWNLFNNGFLEFQRMRTKRFSVLFRKIFSQI